MATRTAALKPSDLARVVVDTTVQPKAVMFPTDAKLLNRAREQLMRLANKLGVELRQSYRRVGKLALIKHQRYAHAHQFKRANRSLRKLKTYLGRIIRDIGRRIAGDDALEEIFARELSLARRVLAQDRHQHERKVHAPEVECIGKGKAHKPYELMAWTTPALRGSVIVPSSRQQEHMPCLTRRSSPSASIWERTPSMWLASTREARLCCARSDQGHSLSSR